MGKRGPQPREFEPLPPVVAAGLSTRAGYVTALVEELNQSIGGTARTQLLKMIGSVYQHFDAQIPSRSPSVPRDPRRYLEWMRSRVRRSMMAHPDKTARLVAQDRDLTAAIDALEPQEPPTPDQLLEELRADLPNWSDDEYLAVHDAGLTRGIPGFVSRDD